MKYFFCLIIISFSLQSCKLNKKEKEEEAVNETVSKEIMKEIDKDENGCLASAGYIWSKLNKECLKLFTGIQLNPIATPQNEDETLSAFILFNEDGSQVELFLPKATETYILKRKSEGQPWVLNEWQIIAKNGYILKQGQKTLYIGDDFIGKKVLGSDTEEQ